MPGISRLFEVRPRALWISAPPPPSRYALSSRRVCLVLNPRIAAAEISVRRLARTSERTSMRCSSRPLIVTKSNLCLPNLIFGRVVWTFQLCTNRTLQLCTYSPDSNKGRYQKVARLRELQGTKPVNLRAACSDRLSAHD